MLGIEDYGSEVESDNEAPPSKQLLTSLTKAPTLSKPRSVSPLPSTNTKTKRPKKIEVSLPSLPSQESEEDERPPAKKPRIIANKVAGTSSLLNMLPPPTQPLPTKTKKDKEPERLLGGGNGPGLVFRAPACVQEYDEGDSQEAPMCFLPLALKNGRSNVDLNREESKTQVLPKLSSTPDVDFFSLGTSSPKPSTFMTPSTSTPPISSAPKVATFTPPPPTPNDPYPGYYLLPSGSWAAHNIAYYATFVRKWQQEYDDHVRGLEKGELEREAQEAAEINMEKEMEKARVEVKEREERKALTGVKIGEPEKPRMNVQGAKLGSTARSRHQLTTLLTDAYHNREALEEKIAQARRNRKEAGNKYGF